MGPLFKHLRLEASEASRLAKARGLRVLEAVGGSFVHIYVSRGVPFLTHVRAQVGPLFKHLRPQVSEASRLAKACGVRVLEALGN